MKEVKGWAKEQKLTDKENKSFAEYYYDWNKPRRTELIYIFLLLSMI